MLAFVDAAALAATITGRSSALLDAWDGADVVCRSEWAEIETPHLVGDDLAGLRMAWTWLLHQAPGIAITDAIRFAAADLAERGCPPMTAVQLATAIEVNCELIVTADQAMATWAEHAGLATLLT